MRSLSRMAVPLLILALLVSISPALRVLVAVLDILVLAWLSWLGRLKSDCSLGSCQGSFK